MYGLEIKTKNKYGKFIYTLLKNAGAERYVWQINSDDILTKNGHGLFHAKWVNGHTKRCVLFDFCRLQGV